MNKNINIKSTEVLSEEWYKLSKVTYNYQKKNGEWETHIRESYDRGNGAVILLYNQDKKSVILTEQFRLPTYLNGNEKGMLIEACAGTLDGDSPEDCIRKEAVEETGYKVKDVKNIFNLYMSPASVTELIHFFVASYIDDMKVGEGGGLDNEQEHIDVLELSFEEAYQMIFTGEIKDAKTVLLLQYAKTHALV
jgi:nudix-type nucleoside diphosphatase (YffH/AdpP family)